MEDCVEGTLEAVVPLAAKAGIVLSVPLGNRLVLIAHLVVGIVGCLLLYVALFLHETEQGELQNRLEKLWIDIDDLSKSALSKQIAFLQQVSALVTSGLDKLSGKKLLSFAAVATSFCFSVSSVSAFWAYFISHIQDHFGEQPTDTNSVAYQSLILIIVAILTVLLGLFPLPFRYLAFIWTPLLFMLAISYDFDYGGFDWSMLDWKDFSMEGMLGPALVTLGGGFVSDILFIATSRWCFRKTAKLNSGWKIVCLLVLRSSIGCVLIAPLFWGIHTLMKNRTLLDWQIAVEMLGGSNLAAASVSFLFLLLALAAVIHLAVWPILEKPIYSLQRFGFVREPKRLAATAVTCLLFAWPHNPFVQILTKLIHG